MTAVSVINAIIEGLNHTIADHLYVELAFGIKPLRVLMGTAAFKAFK